MIFCVFSCIDCISDSKNERSNILRKTLGIKNQSFAAYCQPFYSMNCFQALKDTVQCSKSAQSILYC